MSSSKKDKSVYFNNNKDYGKGNNIKDLFKNAIKQHQSSNITDEKIEQAFAIIDSHSRLLNDQTMINNYNIVVQVIGSILSPYLYDKPYIHTEESIHDFIKEHFDIYVNYEELNENEDDSLMKNYRAYIEDYVINSCMTYFAIFKKDKDLLSKYNKNINEALKNVLTVKNKIFQREMIIKNKKDTIKMPINKSEKSNSKEINNQENNNNQEIKENTDANV